MLRGESGMSVGYKQDSYNQAKNEYKQARKEFRQNAPARVKAERGAKNATKALAKIGAMYIADQKFTGGVGTIAVKTATKGALKVAGMTAITAYQLARGATSIKWYDD
jgi:hypothetical protein